ncbi:PadR family transcriptional regulator [Dictyobacter formicarum]|uniref:PadR family transcriptional regulator n=1 Tax=Dictyobacter formicarum TaxID=2778368 RepID=A0ABQ3VD10_9CHLR|nr:PadR family transcriptional regulator [Dictyobacter formicarum]GHO83674.1 PadR family transcriptional regulator [Dictyobacter formicarum]
MYSDILILTMLRVRPQHGYELKKSVQRVLGQSISLNNKILYPALRRFEDMGAVQRQVLHQEGKPDRHIYQLTDRGMEVLEALLREYTPESLSDNAEFMVRVAFFEWLDPAVCVDILTMRAQSVEKHMQHMNTMLRATEEMEKRPYARRLLQFQLQQIQNELVWIDSLKQEFLSQLEHQSC